MFQQLLSQSKLSEERKQKVLSLFQSPGFPTKNEENWKYTSLKSWVNRDYEVASSLGAEIKVKSKDTYPLVFVNGLFRSELSVVPTGVSVQSELDDNTLTDAIEGIAALARPERIEIQLRAHTSWDLPLELIFISASQAQEAASSAQVQIIIGDSASVSLIESHLQLGTGHFFIYQKTQVSLAANAKCEYLQIQNVGDQAFHLARTQFKVHKDSNLASCVLSLGALQSRSELNLDFIDTGASAQVLGVYALDGNQASDHYTQVRHLKGQCQSTQLYKGLLSDHSKAVFVGGVYIAPDAQKANSEQLNKNLLLSSHAEVNSKPELQIYADDVKAAHGSTIGQLQKEELFYLQSRGIPQLKAKQILANAFVIDVINHLENETLKKHAIQALDKKLGQGKGSLKV